MSRRRVRLALQNPSPYPRAGLLVVPWSSVARGAELPPSPMVVDAEERPIRVQVDRIDPDDPGRDQLVLESPLLPPGDEDYRADGALVELREGSGVPEPRAFAEPDRAGVRLRNRSLELWLHLQPEAYPGSRWFAGSVTSVASGPRIDLLDPIASELGLRQDRERRAMQIDRVRLAADAAGGRWTREVRLFDQPWTLVSTSSGPIRATATIAAPPLPVELPVGGRFRRFRCVICRTVAVHADDDHISDEVWTKLVPNHRGADGEIPDLSIGLHYFMAVNFTLLATIFRYPLGPSWFTITGRVRPEAGYAFATNADVLGVDNPPADFPHPEREHTAFAWELTPRRVVRSFHRFRRSEEAKAFQDRAGRLWYECAFKPLAARRVE